MPRNTTRISFARSMRDGIDGTTGSSSFVGNPSFTTPPRPTAPTVSTRLPIILDYREKLPTSPQWQYVRMNYIASDIKTRSPVAGKSVEAYSAYNSVKDNPILSPQLYEKLRTVNLSNIGLWRRRHGPERHPSQRVAMGAPAHSRIETSAVEYDSPIANKFTHRQGASPVTRSHWLHLIAHSLSDIDPQDPANLVAGSAGANYDHVIFENAVQAVIERCTEVSGGSYSVSAMCLPGDVSVLMKCVLELQLKNGTMKQISFTLDPTKPKLTDQFSAVFDESVIIDNILSFIDAPIKPYAFSIGSVAPNLQPAATAAESPEVPPAIPALPIAAAIMPAKQRYHGPVPPPVNYDDFDEDVDMVPTKPPNIIKAR